MGARQVGYELRDALARITLLQPEIGNALGDTSVQEMDALFDRAVSEGARLIAFFGEGRHFCTGFDLSGLEEQGDGELLLRFVRIERLLRKIYDSPVATAAIGQGAVYGAGADLFAACDHRIAVQGSRFAFPGAGFGLVLGTARLAARVGHDKARSILSGGEAIATATALEAGLATTIVDQDGVEPALETMLAAAGRLHPSTVASLRLATSTGDADAELAALCRSASEAGLKQRIIDYRARTKAGRASR